MKNDEFWHENDWTDVDEWEMIEESISVNEYLFREGFKEWLQLRLQFWKKLVLLAFECFERNDPYGYSTLDLLRRTERDKDLGMVIGESCEYFAELGHLLIMTNPYFEEMLWRGERYSHPVKEFLSKYGFYITDSFYEENPEFRDLIADYDNATYKNPAYMFFPELAGFSASAPVHVHSDIHGLH